MKGDVENCAACGQPKQRDDNELLLTGRMMQVSRLATIGEMTSGVAHELNQPLAAIANYAQASSRVLSRPDPDLADIREALDEISAQALRAAEIIRRMRNLGRCDDAERLPTDSSALVEEMIDLLQADARAHGTQLILDLRPDLPPILVDRVQIQHVLLNLVRNSMEALGAIPANQRKIVLGTTLAADGHVEIYISDNGPGLTAEARDHLLEPFFTTKPAGTGLGLAISNTIVRAHAGVFGHRANTPSGACFYIRIPPISGAES